MALVFAGCMDGVNPELLPITGPSGSLIAAGNHAPSRYLWGWFLVRIEPGTGEFEIVPVREVSTHWNIINFLERKPCTDCFKLVNIDVAPNGNLLVDVRISHPFVGMANLTGFDVRGIAMFNGSKVFPESGVVKSVASLGEGEIVNPDGYTTLYNPTTAGGGPGGLQGYIRGKCGTATFPTATLNPYKRFVSEGTENTRNAFYSGDEIIVQYEVDMPDPGGFVFGYAIDASWTPPSTKPVTDPMTDFPIEANCPEPWKIEVAEHPIGDGLTNLGGGAVLAIDAFDWVAGSHHAPIVECPELFAGTRVATHVADHAGHSSYQVTVANSEAAPIGNYEILVAIEDTENDTAPEWLDLTAYSIVYVDVVEGTPDQDPVASAAADPNPQTVCGDVRFFDNGSFDPDGGDLVLYEWDFNNDGTYDETGAEVYHSWDEPGTYYVQFRVTDDEAVTDTLDQPIETEIGNALPVAVGSGDADRVQSGGVVNFNAVGSHDNDCEGEAIVEYQWENQDMILTTVSPEPVALTFDTYGIQEVMLRVTDDEGAQDELDAPILVTVTDGWCNTWGGAGQDKAVDVATDPDGNIYVVGSFSDTVDFDPGDGTVSRVSHGGLDAFLCKYLPSGVLQYAKTWGGAGEDEASGVAVDGSSAVYVTGPFMGTGIEFDPDGGGHIGNSNGETDIYLSKFDIGGIHQWVVTWGGTDFDVGLDVAVDGAGRALVSGMFQGTAVDFDPGAGTDPHTSNGIFDACVSSFNSSGQLQWAKTWGAGYVDGAYAIDCDGSNNVITTGFFFETVDFDPGASSFPLISKGGSDAFVSWLTQTGAFQWAAAVGGSGYDGGSGLVADETGNVYAVGSFEGTADFDPGAGTQNAMSNGMEDSFLLRLNDIGTLHSVVTWGGAESDLANGLCMDSAGNLFVTGVFHGSDVDFDPGPGEAILSSDGDADVFISRFSSSFELAWVKGWGGSSTENCEDVCAWSDRFIYVPGSFNGEVDFDPGDGTDLHSSAGSGDAFLSKFRTDGNW